MSVDRKRIKAVFLGALDQPAPTRVDWVKERCANDPALEREVTSLLHHHRDAELIAEDAPGDDEESDEPSGDVLGLVGRVLDERYRVEAFVDEGGFGYVYRGHHLRFDEPIAIKVFKPLSDELPRDVLEAAFSKEAALLNKLSRRTHTIAQSYDIGRVTPAEGPPLLFTVLEWIDGVPLDELERPDGGWTLATAIGLLSPIAEALGVAHASGVAHRDVKPANVLVTEEGMKLLDFGIAKVASERSSGFLSTGGPLAAFSVEYAAPEQLNGDPTGPWTDVYALALMLSELVSGRHPYRGASPMKSMLALADPTSRPTPRTLGFDVSDDVEAVFARALAVDYRDRFEDADAFWGALHDAAHG